MKIGLLPLYIKLYDDSSPHLRERLEAFYNEIAAAFRERGTEVITSPFCRIKDEFEEAISRFESEGADAVVTLHMAYSPSLESAKALAETNLPVIVLDTTGTYEFGPCQSPDEISYNHGIHGVMDMCNLLKRNKKVFAIAAGHYKNSDVLDRIQGFVRAACAAGALKNSAVGIIGGGFEGMGDFAVTPEEMKAEFGVNVIHADEDEIKEIYDSVKEDEIDSEIDADRERFELSEDINFEEYRINTRSCLTVRKWIEKHNLSAFSVNFLKAGKNGTVKSVPFLEACKAMSRGIGYAGEGDGLTAAFTGALIKGFRDASFIEIFCPDWKGNTLLLSHMGEMNYAVADNKPQLRSVRQSFTDAENPVIGYARFKEGKAVFANICPTEDGYSLVLKDVEMLNGNGDSFNTSMRGWMRPAGCSIEKFLEELSKNGATHHSMLVYDTDSEQLEFFGRLLGLKVVVI